MNTLRAKLVVLLAVVIVSVVGILTGVLLYLLRPPGGQHIGPVAEQVLNLSRIAEKAPGVLPILPSPADGELQSSVTDWLHEALVERGSHLNANITRRDRDTAQVVSIPTPGGWIVAEVPDLPPRDGGWRALGTWLALITLGALAIAIFVANRMVKPLVLMEEAIESVGPDALIPELPVRGPAEVQVAARALNSLSSRLKTAMESRMRLVAAAGHDMRTPITRMRLRAEFVADDDEQKMWFKDIRELEQIADSAILLVQEEQDKSPAQAFRLDELVDEVVTELKQLDYRIELVSTSASSVRGNRHALSRAFRNLIINAATHGRGARVRMVIPDARAHVIVEDDGPGIPADLLSRVFEPFFRADPARRQEIAGAGLGLTIAREIVRKAGGDITISNRSPHGLMQLVELPLAQVPDAIP